MTTSDVEKPVRSPCVHVCALDEQDVCIGCQRTVAEITRWGRMDNAERREVLQLCLERARASGLLMTSS
ncbi:hypothetical protein PSOLE_10580 [Pseudomonas oleovorans subsp. oleovorans]|uniref:Fe-S protein n=1 Tax=Ectopseudomonas oleovorans TaxID=301 RepID=A0A379JNI7_ECTOL|nr:hypothetical protein PSOLE_10580 [Pseudomonas oleovorans subsp. oleovorans]SEJ46956.1 hypothetical protein SAMN05216280_102456 [Pseudomonas oleovorans]SUD49629.1 Fe-S protein [Pseudomonas oleovorans]SUD50085.1 Fe-S protein [Pseudomonas oleovorans]